MAELHIIGQILTARDFVEPNLFCKYSIQFGSNWKLIEGLSEGQTAACSSRLNNCPSFVHPFDVHLACRGIQGWPKIHVELYTVNALNNCWPVGFGFAHIPTQPGNHLIEINTWKLVGNNLIDKLHGKFHTSGFTVSKSDLIYSGIERYKLNTQSSGSLSVELMIICKNFTNFGVELK